ncbi:hypothetical protein CDL15_Pgr018625 [Punica granatum]|uniref:Uncharacterized protein n=1 Tax=Punica granatum TaxID=22663 RepID=A0A218WZV7_PUNGR|nr:hypothetical protein CDL15_Pgr018625 [Punica granatum]
MLVITEEIGCTILSAKTLNEAWVSLKTQFIFLIAISREFLEQQWQDLYKGGLSMETYLNAAKCLATQFAQIEKPKTSTQLNRRILTSLRLEWESLDPHPARIRHCLNY